MHRSPSQTACQIAEEALLRLAADLEAGRSEILTRYLDALGRLRGQSWSNVLLITAQRPEATRVVGFHGWNDLGRTVKNGEKGLLVFAPAAGQGTYPFRGSGARVTYVFDVLQTEGKALSEPAPTTAADAWRYSEGLRALVVRRGIDAAVDQHRAAAGGPTQYLSVLTHELAQHEMHHHHPEAATLSRDAIDARAHAVAYAVTRGLGVETHADAAQYMVSYAGDKRALAQTLARIQRTSAQILSELRPEPPISANPVLPESSGRARDGGILLDAEAFAETHQRYRTRVVQSVIGFVRDRDVAEDIAAKAFEIAWEKRASFRGDASVHTWIQAIARNEARSLLSRERIVRTDPLDEAKAGQLSASEPKANELERQDDRLRLRSALEQLPGPYRRALVGRFADGLSIREIARREGIPYGTVLSRIFVGKELLRRAWNASGSPKRLEAPPEHGSRER